MVKRFFLSPFMNNAHRGCSLEFPENTYLSFCEAVKTGADVLETDLRLTSDGKVVLIHDENVARLTDRTGKVGALTYQELSSMDYGYRFTKDKGKTFPFRGTGMKIMLFEEALQAFPDVKFNIDLKDKNSALVDAFIKIIKTNDAADRVLAGSFHSSNIQQLRKSLPEIATACTPIEVLQLFFLSRTGMLFLKKNFQGDALQIPEYSGGIRLVHPAFVNEMHKKGLYVYVWTVNTEKDVQRFLAFGVDGIFSDNPKMVKKVLAGS